MSKMFKNLKQGLEEALEHAEGKRSLRSKHIDIPPPPKAYSAKAVQALRKKLKYSQQVFASILNVSVRTVQAWENGSKRPSAAASRLLEIIDSENKRKKFLDAICA